MCADRSTLLDIFSKQMRTSRVSFSSFDVLTSLDLSTELSTSSISISSSSVPVSLAKLVLSCDFSDSASFTDCLANIFNISGVIGSHEANASKTDNAATRTVGSVRMRHALRNNGEIH